MFLYNYLMMIKENTINILRELPDKVELVGAAKTRTPEEILEAVDGGLKIVGENYLQEALEVHEKIGNLVKWHFIGHLQKNKVKKAVRIFDMIESVDSSGLAKEINKRCCIINKIMPVLLEINSGKEPQKNGILPEETESLIKDISKFENIRIMGLMTMGPIFGDPEDARPYFQVTKKLFDKIRGMNIPRVTMKYLSMGMSNTYKTAIEEGATLIRIGTKLFGQRG